MIATDDVLVSRDGATVTLALNRPEPRNALRPAMRHRLADALEEIEADRGVRAVILAGTGEHFRSGGDLSGMAVGTLAAGRERMRQAHRLIRLRVGARVPIIAAEEGWCAGAGISLACAARRFSAKEPGVTGAATRLVRPEARRSDRGCGAAAPATAMARCTARPWPVSGLPA